MNSEINHFDDLLRTARFLPERQRLLFVFASVELPPDATAEQRARFERDRAVRTARGHAAPPIDDALLAALERGLPDCAGVALGVDRLMMAMVGTQRIGDVLAFDFARA